MHACSGPALTVGTRPRRGARSAPRPCRCMSSLCLVSGRTHVGDRGPANMWRRRWHARFGAYNSCALWIDPPPARTNTAPTHRRAWEPAPKSAEDTAARGLQAPNQLRLAAACKLGQWGRLHGRQWQLDSECEQGPRAYFQAAVASLLSLRARPQAHAGPPA
jgi:hypothetical protein